MLFTERFIRVPIKETAKDAPDSDVPGVDPELFDNWEKIDPDDIVSYRPCLNKEGDREESKINVVTKSQGTFPVHWSVKEFEQRMNEFVSKRGEKVFITK